MWNKIVVLVVVVSRGKSSVRMEEVIATLQKNMFVSFPYITLNLGI